MPASRTLCKILSVVLLAGFLAGCAHLPGGIAPSTTPINGRTYTNLGHVTRTDSLILLFGIIPISGSNSTPDAIRECISSRGGDAMIEVSVEAYYQFWILFTRLATRVDGQVIRFTN